jgi:hypothetical protein
LSDAGLTQRQTCFWMMLLAMLLGAVALLILREALYPYAVYAVFWTLAAVWGLRLAVRGGRTKSKETVECSKMQVLRK